MSTFLKRNLLVAFATTALLAATAGSAVAGNSDEFAPNPYAPSYGHAYRHGAVPTREALGRMHQYDNLHAASPSGKTTSGKTLSYGGGVDGIGVTSGTPKVYIVVYGSQWGSAGTDANGNMTLTNDPVSAVPYLQNLFKGLGTGGELWSGVMTQYCDGAGVSTGATFCASSANHIGYPNGPLVSVWYDNSVASPSNATGTQLAQEAIKAAQHFGNTTAASNRYVQYIILSPTGTHPDGFNTSTGNFCAWHDWQGDGYGITSPVGDVAFTNMPYVHDMGTSCGQNFVNSGAQGAVDGFSIVNGHEYAETVTDQNPAGGWTNHVKGSRQSTWSNDTNECDIAHPIVL